MQSEERKDRQRDTQWAGHNGYDVSDVHSQSCLIDMNCSIILLKIEITLLDMVSKTSTVEHTVASHARYLKTLVFCWGLCLSTMASFNLFYGYDT